MNDIYEKNELLMQLINTSETLIKELEIPVKTLSYLMKHDKIESFLCMFISAKNIDLAHILKKEKRKIDRLFTFNENTDETFYVLLCINTKVEGSYKFSERLMRHITLGKGKEIHCLNVEIKGISCTLDELILNVYNDYLELRDKDKTKNVQFKAIH